MITRVAEGCGDEPLRIRRSEKTSHGLDIRFQLRSNITRRCGSAHSFERRYPTGKTISLTLTRSRHDYPACKTAIKKGFQHHDTLEARTVPTMDGVEDRRGNGQFCTAIL
jgi:hypothetical protein